MNTRISACGSSRGSLLVILALVFGSSMWLGPVSTRGQDEGQKKDTEKKDAKKEKAKKADDDDSDDPEPDDEPAAPTRVLGIDEAYVQENLKQFLNADKLEFAPDGRVTIELDFSKKNPEQMGVFAPPLESSPQSNFRYTTGREEHVDYFQMEGIKIANQGRAVLKCWFLDDVVSEVEYIQRGSFTANHMFSLCFSDAQNKKAIGANMGTQCVSLSGGAVSGKSTGKVDSVTNATRTKMKLSVRGGKFEAYKGDRKQSTMDYKPKDFATGQIGFAWGGKIAGSVTYLKITGQIDNKKTAEMLRKGMPK